MASWSLSVGRADVNVQCVMQACLHVITLKCACLKKFNTMAEKIPLPFLVFVSMIYMKCARHNLKVCFFQLIRVEIITLIGMENSLSDKGACFISLSSSHVFVIAMTHLNSDYA